MKVVLGKLFPHRLEKLNYIRARVCAECGNSEISEELVFLKTFSITEKIASLVLEKADSGTIEKEAVSSQGMITMKQDGYIKVLQGVTTIEEVLRVAQE
jgi:type II secretory ATPase GspE/PulE/Tfp pilus assembly ATPase PilB-like protein